MTGGVGASVDAVLTAAGFWLGTVLPVVYVPIVLTGIDSGPALAAFLGLIGLHVAALVVGHDHRPQR